MLIKFNARKFVQYGSIGSVETFLQKFATFPCISSTSKLQHIFWEKLKYIIEGSIPVHHWIYDPIFNTMTLFSSSFLYYQHSTPQFKYKAELIKEEPSGMRSFLKSFAICLYLLYIFVQLHILYYSFYYFIRFLSCLTWLDYFKYFVKVHYICTCTLHCNIFFEFHY